MSRGFLKFVLGLLPVCLYCPFWHYGFELPKIIYILWLGPILLLILILGWWKRINLEKKYLLVIFWWIILVLASLAGESGDNWWWGGVNRFTGGAFFLSLILINFGLSRLISERSWKIIRGGFFWAALVTVTFGLGQKLFLVAGFSIPLYAGRVVSVFGQPNYWADFLIVILVWWWFDRGKIKWGWDLLTVLIFALGVFLSGSRWGIGLFVLVVIIKLFSWRWGVLTGWLLLLINSFDGWDGRVIIWKAVWEKICLQPWHGYGLESMGEVLQAVNLNGAIYVDRAHNLWLQIWFDGGIFALILFLGFLFCGLIKSWQKNKKGVFWGLIFLFLAGSVHVFGAVSWYLLFVLLAAAEGDKEGQENIHWQGWKTILVFIYGLGVLGVLLKSFTIWLF